MWLAIAITALALGLGVWFAARFGFALPWDGDVQRGTPAPIVALHDHLARQGIATRVRLVRTEQAGAHARAIFSTTTAPEQSFFVVWFGQAATAAGYAVELNAGARTLVADANGPLLLMLPEAVRDSALAQPLVAAFRSHVAAP